MNKTARILVVDDDPAILQVFSEVLRTAGYEVCEAATGQEGLQATREKRPDLVLLDLSLPDLSGTEVCRQIKSDPQLEDVFVSLFSGSAVSAADQAHTQPTGADEFIVKPVTSAEFLARVRTMVRLHDTKAALRASEQHYRQLVEILPDGVWLLDQEGRLLALNPQAAAMAGYAAASELVQKSAFDLLDPAQHDRFRADLATALTTGLLRNAEYTMVERSGERFPVEISAAAPAPADTRPARLVTVVRDITKRKQAEQALQNNLRLLQTLMDAIPSPVFYKDTEGRYLGCNRAFEQGLGVSQDQIKGKTVHDIAPLDVAEKHHREELQLIEQPGVRNYETSVFYPDGSRRQVMFRKATFEDAQGKVAGLVGAMLDVTERKQAEEQIQMLADAVQSTSELISISDPENRFTFVNQSFLALYGYREEEVLGRKPDFLYSPKNPPGLVERIFEQTLSGGWEGEVLNCRKDGSEFPISLSTSQIKNRRGVTIGLMAVAKDVSERKRAERQNSALSRLGHRLSAASTREQATRIILDIASELFGWDAGFVHLYLPEENKIIRLLTMDTVNHQRVEVPPARPAATPTPLMSLVMRQGPRLIDQANESALPVGLVPFGNTGRRSACKMFVPIKSGELAVGILSIQSYTPGAYSQEDLKILQTLADRCGDALERIKVADALRETEAKYRSIVENATEGIFQTTPTGCYRSANRALARMFGYASAAELMANVSDNARQTYVVPERREELKRLLEEQNSVQGFEAERYRRDGSKFWISINAHVVRDPEGAVLYYEGTNIDITERKQAGAVLRESEEKFRTLFESAPIGIALHDAHGHYVQTNQAYQLMLGYTNDELLRLGARRVTHPDDIAEGQSFFNDLREGKRDQYCREKRYLAKGGHLVWAQSSASSIRNSKGELIYIISMVEDITERKRVVEALRQSERKLRLIAENTTDVIFAFDMERKPVYANPAVEGLTGYTFAEIQAKKFINWIHPEDQTRMLKHWEALFSGKGYSETEFRLITKAGRVKWCSSTWGPLFDETGRQIGVQGRERDITERKRIEEDLRRVPGRIIEAQEAERLRVARELHDGVNQLLASAKMRLGKVTASLVSLGPAGKEILARCDQLLVQALEENRRIAHNLRPSDLDELGLAAACRNFCKELQSRANLAVKCRITPHGHRCPQFVELNLFRIVQEALTNAEHHARAKTIWLRIGLQGDFLVLSVKDDGRGFDPKALKPGKRKMRGIGLTNIRERASALGGTCEVVSAPDQGTTITVRVPCLETKSTASGHKKGAP